MNLLHAMWCERKSVSASVSFPIPGSRIQDPGFFIHQVGDLMQKMVVGVCLRTTALGTLWKRYQTRIGIPRSRVTDRKSRKVASSLGAHRNLRAEKTVCGDV